MKLSKNLLPNFGTLFPEPVKYLEEGAERANRELSGPISGGRTIFEPHAKKRDLGNMSVENAVKKLDEASNSQDLNAVLSFYEDDAVLVARPGSSFEETG